MKIKNKIESILGIGVTKWYYPHGKIRCRGIIINDTFEGLWEDFYKNGTLESKGHYNNGKRVGVWEDYSLKKGKINALTFYI